jgi:hypothetical protein
MNHLWLSVTLICYGVRLSGGALVNVLRAFPILEDFFQPVKASASLREPLQSRGLNRF